MYKHLIAGLAAGAILCSCSDSHIWSIKGTIENAPENAVMALEANNAGRWYTVDSVRIASDGTFSYQSNDFDSPAVMRLTLAGKSIHFPVDSLSELQLTADANTFGTAHRLSGNSVAEAFSRIDSIASSTADRNDKARMIVGQIAADTTGLAAYYAVGKAVDGKALFDPNDSFGNKVYGAAAQVYASYRPDDPKGKALAQAYFNGRRALGKQTAEPTVIEVPETGLFDIVRYDWRGNEHSLSELAKDKTVLLNFTDYSLQNSPAYNAMLKNLRDKYQANGLEIYQIAFDSDEPSWKEAARNLPWVAVWNSQNDGSAVLVQYNVDALPLTYIIKDGTIVERVDTASELPSILARHM